MSWPKVTDAALGAPSMPPATEEHGSTPTDAQIDHRLSPSSLPIAIPALLPPPPPVSSFGHFDKDSIGATDGSISETHTRYIHLLNHALPRPQAPHTSDLTPGFEFELSPQTVADGRQRVVSAPHVYSTSPRSPLALSTSPDSPPRRRSAQFPPVNAGGSPSSPPLGTNAGHYLATHSRRRRSSASLSTSPGSSSNTGAAPLFGSLVGSFEHSLLAGRLSTLPSLPLPFVLSIGVLGDQGASKALKCPAHLNLPLGAFYYAGTDGNTSSSPYVGTVDLEAHYLSLLQPTLDDAGVRSHTSSSNRKLPKFPGYQVPCRGQVQLVVKNPNSTAVKLFLIPYDLTGLDRQGQGGKTFLRQKSYTIEDEVGDASIAKGKLRYAVHLQFCSPPSKTRSNEASIHKNSRIQSNEPRYYLHGNVRVVFASRALDSTEKLKIVAEGPQGIIDKIGPDGEAAHHSYAAYGGPSAEWDMARRKAQEREKLRKLVDACPRSPDRVCATTAQMAARTSSGSGTPQHDPNGTTFDSSLTSSTATTPSRSTTPFAPFSDIASLAFAAPFSFTAVSDALPASGENELQRELWHSRGREQREVLTRDPLTPSDSTDFVTKRRPLRSTSRSGLSSTRPPSREEDCGR
ncbi:hypothetical protein OIO90_001072 [Microbotryomycetes sp. JL221]|nr:hypothetical protein OIO90_001072 [Microbotryomycetes sp. JL221]